MNRVEAQTDVDNIAEQRSLEKAGFVREGTARGSQFRAGAYHDLVTYSILRDDRKVVGRTDWTRAISRSRSWCEAGLESGGLGCRDRAAGGAGGRSGLRR